MTNKKQIIAEDLAKKAKIVEYETERGLRAIEKDLLTGIGLFELTNIKYEMSKMRREYINKDTFPK